MLRKILKFLSNNDNIIIQSGNIVNGTMYSGSVIINGKKVQELETGTSYEIVIEGNVNTLTTQGSVTINGNVEGDVDTQGSVKVNGDVGGSVDTQGSVTVGGNVSGDIDTMGRVTIGKKL